MPGKEYSVPSRLIGKSMPAFTQRKYDNGSDASYVFAMHKSVPHAPENPTVGTGYFI